MGHKSRTFIFGAVSRKAMVTVLLATTALPASIALVRAEAFAQSSSQTNFKIPAGSLSSALAAFGSQSGTQISYDASLAAGKSSPGVQGAATREQALARILEGSGLGYSFADATNVVITDRVAAAHESSAIATDGSLVLDTINVEGGRGNAVYDPYRTAAATDYISEEDIERFRGSTPGDIFRGTPGVISAGARNSAGSIDPNIRGMQGMGRVTVKVDDAENQISVYQGYQGISNRTFVDPDLIAGIDITKGSDAASSGVAGTVAIRTLDASDIVKDGKQFGLRIKGGSGTNTTSPERGNKGGYLISNPLGSTNDPSSGYGSATGSPDGLDRPAFLKPTQGSASVVGAMNTENVDLLAGYAYRERGNYFAGRHGPSANIVSTGPRQFCYSNGDCPEYLLYRDYLENQGIAAYRAGEEVLNTQLRTESYIAKGTVRFGDGHSVKLGYNGYRSEAGDLLASTLGSEYSQPTQQAQTTGIRLNTGTAQYRWNPDDSDLFDVKSNLWISKLEQRNPIRLRNWLNPPPSGYGLPDDFRVGSDTTMWGGDVSNTSKLDTSYGLFSLNYGLSYKDEDTTPSAYTRMLEGAGLRDGDRREASIYGKASWHALDWLTINSGLRYQRYWAEDRSAQASPNNYDPATYGQKLDGGGFSPSFGVTVEPIKGTQLYVNYSDTMRSPSIMESLTGFSTVFNPTLKPERSSNWEIGSNFVRDDLFAAGDRGMLKLGYFNWSVSDYIAREFATIPTNGLNVQTMRLFNMHEANFSGIELSSRYELGGFTAELAANYYLDVEYCRTADSCGNSSLYADYATNQVPPEYSVDLTLSQKLFDDALTIGGRVNYTGPRAIGHGETTVAGASSFISLVKWEPYTLVDVFAEYKITDSLTATGRIENLFDKFYVDPLSLVTQPGPGRTFYVSLTAKF
ncbi:TonB-dependent receptor [Agrobacterium sp. AGB01]|uniref:TonB-dependent receptor n=1 Tax=Agrobacterium sp. AGB01 TaxID=2769302 RepID=UPI001FEFD9D1|nr:TonB-dependent receptor [Agrobacterium sp. AGB01]